MKPVILIAALLVARAAPADQRVAIINVEGCNSVGPSPVLNWSLVEDGYLNDSMMALGFHTGMLLCDAELPPGAYHFDYAELEYNPGTWPGPPWVIAYATRRQRGPAGEYLWLEEIGSCGGLDPAAWPAWEPYTSNPQLSICQTPGGIDLVGAPDQVTSVLFLVVMPVDHFASTDTQPALFGYQFLNRVYRIVEYYEQ